MTPRRVAAAALLTSLVAAVPALAATKNGVTPIAPKAGATVPVGTAPTFRSTIKGKGSVYVVVCKSAKRSAKEGIICNKETIGQAKRKAGTRTYSYKPTLFDFPEYFLQRPGTYYWQAYRIECKSGGDRDCLEEGPVTKFRVG